MTGQEEKLIEILTDFWNKYLQLPQQHPCDQQEMCDSIHRAQHLIMIRETRRNNKEIFPIYTNIDVEVNSVETMEEDITNAVNKGIKDVFKGK